MIDIEKTIEGITGVKTATEYNSKPIMWVYAYRIGDALIDAGCSNSLQELRDYNEKQPVKNVYITHAHEDHVGGVSIFARTGKIYAPATSIDRILHPPDLPDFFKFAWGEPEPIDNVYPLPEEFDIDNFHFRVMGLPGHIEDMVGFFEPDRKWLFSGDAVPSPSRKYFAMPEENIPRMIATMEHIQTLGLEVLFDAHRGLIESPYEHIQKRIDYLKETQERVKEMHRDGMDFSQMMERLKLTPPWFMEMTKTRFSIDFFLRSLVEDTA